MGRTYVGRRQAGGKWVDVVASGRIRPLVDRGHRRSKSFGWGAVGAGSVSLAHAILEDVLGTETSEGLAITFAGDVICRLPEESFTLGEGEVRDWLEGRGQRPMDPDELVEHLGSIALADPEEEAEVLRGLVDRCWTARSLVN